MPLTNLSFMTDGTWENTSVMNHTNTVACRRIFVDLDIHNTDEGHAGIDEGGQLEGYIDVVRQDEDVNRLDVPLDRQPIFPGAVSFRINGRSIRVECSDPELNFLTTTVEVDGMDMTDSIARVFADIDAIDDRVSIWVKYKSGEPFGIAEFETSHLI